MSGERVVGRIVAALATLGMLTVVTAVVEPAGAGTSGANSANRAEGAGAPALPPQGAIPNIEAAGWDLVFDDDFDQGSLDESVWWAYQGPGKSGPGWNTREAVRVEPDAAEPGDGLMSITTYTENGKHYTGEVQTGEAGQAAGFTGAYGYVEARVRLHTPPDSWDAFWLLPSNSVHAAPIGDPAAAGPEIDIFETGAPGEGDGAEPPDGECDWQPLPFPCDQIAGGTLHWNGFDEHHETASQSIHWNGGDQDRFINYGLLWTPQGYRIYWDGILVFESAEGVSAKPEHLIFGQYNHDYRRPPGYSYGSLATSPYKMEVDYVKVWQRPVQQLPDQTVPGNTSAAIPFSVTDHFSTSTSALLAAQPGAVRVTATSSNTNVVPSSNLVVLGNPADGVIPAPTNGGFEGSINGWTPSGTPTPATSSTKKHSGSTSLKLTDAGGRVEQTITGLQPSTTYALGGWYNLELEWNDADGNGRIDTGESVTDGGAAFDWGVQDVDSAMPGAQPVVDTRDRSEWRERGNYWAPHQNEWRERHLTFTTGPTTTSVDVFVDNLVYKNTGSDSNMYFDDLYLRPLTPPDRTVVARPKDNTAGFTDITLTARNAAGTQIGDAETFRLTFTRAGSFTNGDFESQPAGKGWELWDNGPGVGAEVVVENPFTLNRALELAGPMMPASLDLAPTQYINPQASGTAFQTVNNLKPGQQYRLEVTGKGKFYFSVSGHGGADPCATLANCEVSSADWFTKSFTFTMGTAPTNTSARVTLLDWTPGDGVSLVDNVKLSAVTSAGNSYPTRVSPTFTTLGAQIVPSSAPVALPFDVPTTNPATTITGVRSSNQELVADRDLRWAVNGNNTMGVLGFSPQRERTGKTTITITYTGPGGTATKDVPVTVTARQVENPAFEMGNWNWGGTVENGALTLNGPQAVSQIVTGLPHGTDFLLGARTNGAVNVEVRPIADANMKASNGTPWPSFVNPVVTASWNGSGWTDNSVRVATTQCPDCTGRGSRRHVVVRENNVNVEKLVRLLGGQVQITLTDANPGDSQAVYVDDITLLKAPTMDHIRDLSIYQTQTSPAWNTRTLVDVGNVPANGLWNPAVSGITSSNAAAVPTSNLSLVRPDQLREFEWMLQARAGAMTGRSNVAVKLTDPATGIATERQVTVNVNAGNNFNNGDFEDGTDRWEHGWVNDGYGAVKKQTWRYLDPVDDDQVLRISSGIVGYKVTGLTAGERYAVQANAVGNGSTVRVYANTVDRTGCYDSDPGTGCTTFAWGEERGSVTINSSTWAATPNLVFTTIADVPTTTGPLRNETDVWIVVYDNDLGDYDPCTPDEDQQGPNCTNPDYDPTPASDRYCSQPAAGETCIDDIGIFKASDVGL